MSIKEKLETEARKHFEGICGSFEAGIFSEEDLFEVYFLGWLYGSASELKKSKSALLQQIEEIYNDEK